MRRRHGYQRPLDPHQVGAFILFSGLSAGCYAFCLPVVENVTIKWFLVALYSLLVGFVVSLHIICSSSDPSDPGLRGATHGEFYCALCQASVSRTSKHCRACDRCVEGFDHHCKWLNNCIGQKNYKPFFLLVTSTVSMLAVQLGWAAWLFVISFTRKAVMKLQVSDAYAGKVAYAGWQASLMVYMVFLIAAILMLGELLVFHVVLISKGMTTYDYIIAQRDQTTQAIARPAGSANNQQACEACRPNKVHDGQMRTESVLKRKLKVGINPCAALKSQKPQGDPRSWDRSGLQPPNASGPTSQGQKLEHMIQEAAAAAAKLGPTTAPYSGDVRSAVQLPAAGVLAVGAEASCADTPYAAAALHEAGAAGADCRECSAAGALPHPPPAGMGTTTAGRNIGEGFSSLQLLAPGPAPLMAMGLGGVGSAVPAPGVLHAAGAVSPPAVHVSSTGLQAGVRSSWDASQCSPASGGAISSPGSSRHLGSMPAGSPPSLLPHQQHHHQQQQQQHVSPSHQQQQQQQQAHAYGLHQQHHQQAGQHQHYPQQQPLSAAAAPAGATHIGSGPSTSSTTSSSNSVTNRQMSPASSGLSLMYPPPSSVSLRTSGNGLESHTSMPSSHTSRLIPSGSGRLRLIPLTAPQ